MRRPPKPKIVKPPEVKLLRQGLAMTLTARRQQGWLCQSGSRAAAVQGRDGTAALLECESLLSLCGGGKLASWGGALGVDRGLGGFSWLGLSAGVVVRDASWAGFPKAAAGLPQSKGGFLGGVAPYFRLLM